MSPMPRRRQVWLRERMPSTRHDRPPAATGAAVAATVALVCAVTLLEDPVMLAWRTRLHAAAGAPLVVDLQLAVVMVSYNLVVARIAVRVVGTSGVLEALDVVRARRVSRASATPSRALRTWRRTVARCDPFALLRWAGDRVTRLGTRPGRSGGRRPWLRGLLVDLGTVNVLGVPAAALALASDRVVVPWRTSVRHSLLYVTSWFVILHLASELVDVVRATPIAGDLLTGGVGAAGDMIVLATDPTAPLGLLAVLGLTAAVVRDVRAIRRELAGHTRA